MSRAGKELPEVCKVESQDKVVRVDRKNCDDLSRTAGILLPQASVLCGRINHILSW